MSDAAKAVAKSYYPELKDLFRCIKELVYMAASEAYDEGWEDCLNALADLEEEEESDFDEEE